MTTTSVDHYGARFWNDLPGVERYLRRRSTGDAGVGWMEYLKARYATPARERALVVGCGNGWVERSLHDCGVAKHFDAFDGSPQYLRTAEAERGERPITYRLFDFNTWAPERRYDLVVNVAALHHVRYLFRMSKLLSEALRPGGIFVHWEYIGPSRNQYGTRHLAIMRAVNEALPERFRTQHPLVHTVAECIAGDPTEAVHAADIPRALDHFFEPVERKMLGGGIAYQLLWNNIAEFEKGDAEALATLEWLLRLDESLTERGIVPSLFAFMIYRKRARKTTLAASFDRLVAEPVRERFSEVAHGYYPLELLREHRLTRHLFRRRSKPFGPASV